MLLPPRHTLYRRCTAAALLLATLVVGSACSRADSKPAPTPANDVVAQAIDAWRISEGVAAVVVGIDSPKLGRIVIPKGTVAADSSRAVVEDDQFRIGSITKTFTAAVILRLAAEGRLSLDDTVAQHVPEVRVPNADLITIRQLLANRSGLSEYQDAPGFNEAIVADFSRSWTTAEVLTQFGSAAPTFVPGERYSYSSTNFLLLALIAESVTGEPFATTVSSQLLDPQRLGHTSLRTESSTERVHGYSRKFAPLVGKEVFDTATIPFQAIETSSIGAGEATSNAPDLLTWGRALYGGDVLPAASRAAMLTFDPAFGPYGLGAFAFETHHGRAVGHGGEDPGFTSTLMYFPADDLVITVLASTDDIALEPLVERVLDLLVGPGISRTTELVQSLGSPDVATRRDAALALGQVTSDTDDAIEALAGAVGDDPSPDVRAAAALALGIVGKSDQAAAARILRNAASDPDASVRDAATRALQALSGAAP